MTPRFRVSSPEALIDLARVADPPVVTGDRAELQLDRRRVMLQSHVVDFEVTWTEVAREHVEAAHDPTR